MKRNTALVISLLVIVALSLAIVAIAAEMQKGTIKAVDTKAGTITFCQEGTTMNMMLKADKTVDLHMVKPDTKAEVTVEKGMVKSIKELPRPKANYGC